MRKIEVGSGPTASTARRPPVRWMVGLFLTLSQLGCGNSVSGEFPFTVLCLTDTDVPLHGVPVEVEGKPAGSTDRSGLVRLRVRGAEGETVRLAATCPQGFRESRQERRLTLRRFTRLDENQPTAGPRIVWQCHPARRLAALVVRSDGREGLPVMAGGRELARTGPLGTAHALLELAPGSSLTIRLDTAEHPRLRPQSPQRSFRLEDRDTLWIFDQKFSEKRIRRRLKRRRVEPRPQVPYRIR